MKEHNVPVSRQWLESLSTDELVKLADTYSIDIPPGLERIFTIEEILEASSMDSLPAENEIVENPSYSETALLPKQYSISFLEVIIRDPLWVFVFWEIKTHEREIFEHAKDFNGYFLRVIPYKDQKPLEDSFTVLINPDDNARYIGFAEQSNHSPDSYVIKLGALRGESEVLITSCEPFCLPRLSDNEDIAEICKNPLIRLSGAQDLIITKNLDRQSRAKRQ